MPAEKADKEVLSVDGAQRMSTFYGYYMLQAMAKAGNYTGALNNIRTFWGAMLDLGATTFWEDFNLDWVKNASRIDETGSGRKKRYPWRLRCLLLSWTQAQFLSWLGIRSHIMAHRACTWHQCSGCRL